MGLKQFMQRWLEIQPALSQKIRIQEANTLATQTIINQMWYRGDADEIYQMYSMLYQGLGNTERFWAKAPNRGIRKIHTGLPAIMIDTLVNIVKGDIPDVDFEDPAHAARWEEIAAEIAFDDLLGSALTTTLVEGDGAFKLSIDNDLSDHPLVEFYGTSNTDLRYKRGRFMAADFRSTYRVGKNSLYELIETYEAGKYTPVLYDDKGNPVSIRTVPEIADLRPLECDHKVIAAVPFRVFRSAKWPDRGASLYDKKTDDFDALDEVTSQWLDAVRAGRVQRYIPQDMLPRDPKTGALADFNTFGANYIVTAPSASKEDVASKIETIQPEIRYEAYLTTYTTALDMCLQGILSPATLGIDIGKMSSGEAQREKKDVTGNTRNAITAAMERMVPKLVETVLQMDDIMHNDEPGSYPASITFGEYGAPDFDSRVQALAPARTAGLMSDVAVVDELWGSSKDDAWKKEEVKRLREERGIAEAPEPAVADEVAW